MENDILHIATSLKKNIEQEASGGAKSLIDFAKEYAVEKKLHYDSVLLKLKLTKAKEPAAQKNIQQEMHKLVDAIVSDYQKNGQSVQAIATKNRLDKLEDHYAKQKAPDDIVFESKDLGKTYKSTGFTLKDINLQLRLGEITSVVGENGNGKTTLFNLVVGELPHDKGSISFPYLQKDQVKKIRWHQVKQHIAYVPQELPSWDGSLKQMLQFEAAIHKIRGKDNDREVNYIVQRLGLEDHLNKDWSELSGGFKLRFSIAKALIWKPKLLVIDEPLANLDIKTQLLILKDLRNMANSFRYPMAVLLSSQHLHEIEAVSDKILFLEEGNVSFYGKMENLGESRKHNTYELNCTLSLANLKTKLDGFAYQKVYHNGISFVLTTSLETDYKQVLQFLMKQDIEINYFRNISQSVKLFFE